eukprot:NODE_1115_length_1695_cov_12.283111_g988_i0.p1 GENE.NODE_1115_length_1695_cov_12.283111_g988_i0~~NODE_1115_length_1695_cov_12.283111_g988_i0.p1  ORF type:complete len:492 (-),score=94.98 NODE_1115_length_1695_cov_12.283111_g988_i0:220-1491(-)
MRIADRQHPSKMPVNMAPVFTEPHDSLYDIARDFEILEKVDRHYERLSHTTLQKMKNLDLLERSPSPNKKRPPQKRGPDSKALPAPESDLPAIKDATPVVSARTVDELAKLQREFELVSHLLGDVCYEAYSQFLQNETGGGAFYMSLPVELQKLIGYDALEELVLRILRFIPASWGTEIVEEELADTARELVRSVVGLDQDLGVDFWIPRMEHRPIPQLIEECRKWARAWHAGRRAKLEKAGTLARKSSADGEAGEDGDDNESLPGHPDESNISAAFEGAEQDDEKEAVSPDDTEAEAAAEPKGSSRVQSARSSEGGRSEQPSGAQTPAEMVTLPALVTPQGSSRASVAAASSHRSNRSRASDAAASAAATSPVASSRASSRGSRTPSRSGATSQAVASRRSSAASRTSASARSAASAASTDA